MLFDVLDSSRVVDIDLPIISDNYTLLYFDEFPMLYTGTNEDGQRIFGSLICEDEDKDIFRYLHLIVKNKDYLDFIKHRISYRELIEKQKSAFLIDKDELDNIVNTFCVPIKAIPIEFLPHKDLLCPNAELVIGTEFTISLKGKIGDIHEALMNPVSKISKNASQILNSIIEGIKISGLIPEIHQVAYSPTSFGINFRVKFNSNDIFFNPQGEAALNEFVSSTVSYSLTELNSEAQKLSNNEIEGSEYQKKVLQPLHKAYDLLHQKIDDKTQDKLLTNVKKIPFELEKMSEQLGQGFEYLEIKSHNRKDNTTQSVGVIDNNFSNELAIATNIIESANGAVIDQDEEYKDYPIHVYHLNLETRKGNAHIIHTNQDGKQITDSPKIEIGGNGELAGSIFIQSMDTGETITIKGKARKVNNRYKVLKIEFA